MKIYFGDNQFLGVNHADDKSSIYLDKYANPEDIKETLIIAHNSGIRDFCFTVNEKIVLALKMLDKKYKFNLHPCIPYAQEVNNQIQKNGVIGAILEMSKGSGFLGLFLGITSAIFKKYDLLLYQLVKYQLKDIDHENIKSVGLLNTASDFALGLKRYDLLHTYYKVIKYRFKYKPMFFTMNFPLMAECIWGKGYYDCSLVFNYNIGEFRTNPSMKKVQESLKKYAGKDAIAMSVFSGSSKEDVEKLFNQEILPQGILFGSSREENIRSNIKFFEALK